MDAGANRTNRGDGRSDQVENAGREKVQETLQPQSGQKTPHPDQTQALERRLFFSPGQPHQPGPYQKGLAGKVAGSNTAVSRISPLDSHNGKQQECTVSNQHSSLLLLQSQYSGHKLSLHSVFGDDQRKHPIAHEFHCRIRACHNASQSRHHANDLSACAETGFEILLNAVACESFDQIYGILNPQIHASSAQRRMDMCRVPGDEYTPFAVGLSLTVTHNRNPSATLTCGLGNHGVTGPVHWAYCWPAEKWSPQS